MDLSRYADLFLSESREHLSAINQQLLELEGHPDANEPLHVIFRSVHTVKGMSATMGYAAITGLTHALESMLDRMRRGEQRATPAVIEVLFRCADLLESAVELSVGGREDEIDIGPLLVSLSEIADSIAGAEGGDPGSAAAAEPSAVVTPEIPAHQDHVNPPARHSGAMRHARIDVRRLDALMNVIGELVIARGRLSRISEDMGVPALDEAVGEASKLISELQEEIILSRLVPAGQVFDRFPRLVRDSAHSMAKQVEFVVEGRDLELDRSLLDEIGDPVVHLLRNAVDHGIEKPEERLKAGKPAVGRLTLSATRERSAITIRVTDDGRGIDRDRVLRKAQELGLTDESRSELTDDELMKLISRPGFSTAERVTDISGRGVGVDVVNTRVRALGGTFEIRSVPGEGTTVMLRLPLTLAIVRALLARVEGETYAIPLTHVNAIIELEPSALQRVKGRDVLVVRDNVLPLIRFREIAQMEATSDSGRQVVVLEVGERLAGLVVDELTGQQDIVVKQFDGVRNAVSAFSGATILGDGAPALIVDVNSLL